MKKVAVVQSNYIPWKGYFDLIRRVDEFILYDDAQYTRSDWRNRNKIKTPNGTQWLTIPVQIAGNFGLPIKDIHVSDPNWGEHHWKTLQTYYGRTPYFKHYRNTFEPLYFSPEITSLSQINYRFIRSINELLSIKTLITWSMDYTIASGKTEKVLSFCQQVGATCYISGPSAKGYLDVEMFNSNGIEVEWMSYQSYPTYPQFHPPFEHAVSILDLLFHTGEDALQYLEQKLITVIENQ